MDGLLQLFLEYQEKLSHHLQQIQTLEFSKHEIKKKLISLMNQHGMKSVSVGDVHLFLKQPERISKKTGQFVHVCSDLQIFRKKKKSNKTTWTPKR
jgi:hypothetical protein